MRMTRTAVALVGMLAVLAGVAQGVGSDAPETVRGTLSVTDEALPSGEYLHLIDRFFIASVPVVLTLRSTDFDPYLAILDPAGEVVLEVDDSIGFGLDVHETWVPALSGMYRLVVTSALPAEVGAYELTIAVGAAGAQPPVGLPGATDQRPASSARALDPSSGTVGRIPIGGQMVGRLAGSERTTYHTYVVDVPPGTSRISFVMSADADLDLFVKYGSDIVDWGDAGDWDQRDIEVAPHATVTVSGPRPGLWYVDVVFPNGGSQVANYTFEVR